MSTLTMLPRASRQMRAPPACLEPSLLRCCALPLGRWRGGVSHIFHSTNKNSSRPTGALSSITKTHIACSTAGVGSGFPKEQGHPSRTTQSCWPAAGGRRRCCCCISNVALVWVGGFPARGTAVGAQPPRGSTLPSDLNREGGGAVGPGPLSEDGQASSHLCHILLGPGVVLSLALPLLLLPARTQKGRGHGEAAPSAG